MSFLSAVFLWGLPLVTVPVVIHLLHRRRRDIIQWGAMRFLVEATTRRRRVWRIEDLLLMLLRAAVVAAVILALARPLLQSHWFGASGARDVILVFDTSMSTARENGGQSVFEAQLDEVDGLIDGLKDSDLLRVVLASSAPEWLAPVGIPMSAGSKAEVRSNIQNLEPTLASADMMASLQRAIEIEATDERATRLIAVVTDGQSHGWRPAAVDGWRGLAEKVKETNQPTMVNVRSVGDPDRALDNLAVESVAASRALAGANETIVLTASVQNTGDIASDSTLLSWEEDEESLGVTVVPALDPGESTNVSIEYVFSTPGVYSLGCRLKRPDELELDDAGRLIVEVIDEARVLVVDGDPDASPLKTKIGYLLAALGGRSSDDENDWNSVFRPHVVDISELEAENLSEYQCVVLADVPSLPEKAIEDLFAFVQKGGGIWVTLGDQTDPVYFNESLFADGTGLCPLPLQDATGDETDREQFVSLRPPSPNHPATELLADVERLDIHRTHVYRRYRFLQRHGDEAVSILLTTETGEPLAVENVVGRGRVIVQAVPLGADWTNLPACQSFVVMVHEWLWYLIEPSATQWNLNVGETLALSVPTEAFGPQATVTTPRGSSTGIEAEARENEWSYSFAQTFFPGDYILTLKEKNGRNREFPFYVQRDVDESDLTPLNEDEVELLSTVAGVSFVDDPLAKTRASEVAPPSEPLWPWLLILLLIIMIMELILAARLTRRRQTQSPGLAIGGNAP
jgi:hypothetical protein